MAQPWLAAFLALIGYLLGSIPFGVVVSRALGTVDPRAAGSRNIGFTNVLRVGGTPAGVLTLVGDMAKGGLIAALATRLLVSPVEVLAVAATPVLGHLFPVFLRFRGGKGVATAFGVLIGLRPEVGLTMMVIWLIAAWAWRYSSGAAVTAFAILPGVAVLLHGGREFIAFCVGLGTVILLRHKDNIVRLWQGSEPKIGQRAA